MSLRIVLTQKKLARMQCMVFPPTGPYGPCVSPQDKCNGYRNQQLASPISMLGGNILLERGVATRKHYIISSSHLRFYHSMTLLYLVLYGELKKLKVKTSSLCWFQLGLDVVTSRMEDVASYLGAVPGDSPPRP